MYIQSYPQQKPIRDASTFDSLRRAANSRPAASATPASTTPAASATPASAAPAAPEYVGSDHDTASAATFVNPHAVNLPENLASLCTHLTKLYYTFSTVTPEKLIEIVKKYNLQNVVIPGWELQGDNFIRPSPLNVVWDVGLFDDEKINNVIKDSEIVKDSDLVTEQVTVKLMKNLLGYSAIATENWLDGEVIREYIRLFENFLIKSDRISGIVIVDPHFMVSYFEKNIKMTPAKALNFLKSTVSFEEPKLFIIPVNRVDHWYCIVLDIEENKFYRYDPFPIKRLLVTPKALQRESKEILTYLTEKVNALYPTEIIQNEENWEIILVHDNQQDIINCGVYLCTYIVSVCFHWSNNKKDCFANPVNSSDNENVRRRYHIARRIMGRTFVVDCTLDYSGTKIENAVKIEEEKREILRKSIKRINFKEDGNTIQNIEEARKNLVDAVKKRRQIMEQERARIEKDSQIKVALAFLAHDGIKNLDLWTNWFREDMSQYVSVTVWDERPNREELSNAFYMKKTFKTKWGHETIVDAKVLLLGTILEKYPSATHIVMLSGTCIPLVTPTELLDVLSRYRKSRINLTADVKEGRRSIKKNFMIKSGEMKIYTVPHQPNFILSNTDAKIVTKKWDAFKEKTLPLFMTKKIVSNILQKDRDGIVKDRHKDFLGYPDQIFFGTVLYYWNYKPDNKNSSQGWTQKTPDMPEKADLYTDDRTTSFFHEKDSSLHMKFDAVVDKEFQEFKKRIRDIDKDTQNKDIETPSLFFRKVVNLSYEKWKDDVIRGKDRSVYHEKDKKIKDYTSWRTWFEQK